MQDAEGRRGVAAIDGTFSPWIHFAGELAAGHRAGLAVFRHVTVAGEPWSVRDWGTVDVNPLRRQGQQIKMGEELDYAIRYLLEAIERDPREVPPAPPYPNKGFDYTTTTSSTEESGG